VLASAPDMQQELSWLKKNVYGDRNARVEVESLGGKVRYSTREGHKEVVTL
jgi:DNA polymerase III subunit epsilon